MEWWNSEEQSRMGADQVWREGDVGTFYSTGSEFRVCKRRSVLEICSTSGSL